LDYVKPGDFIASIVETAALKGRLPVRDVLVRGFLAGALLGFATSLAFLATSQTGSGLAGAVVFPVGLVMIVLLGLELVTGSFGLLPLACGEGKLTLGEMLANFAWVFLANLLGSLFYGVLLYVALTMAGHVADTSGISEKLVAAAQAKTVKVEHFGAAGVLTIFVKAALCNWMVCLGVVLGFASTSTFGKIAAVWLPIFTFFFLGYEHSVVNMFVIPTGMLFGAKVSLAQWWLWNQIPVTLGNFVGGYVFTGLALYVTYRGAANVKPDVALGPSASATTYPLRSRA